jgi:hypothetical protein
MIYKIPHSNIPSLPRQKMKIRTDTIVNVQYQTATAAVKNLNNLKDIK